MSPTLLTLYLTFLLTIFGLALHRTHLLSALLCLEGMMLALFMAMSMWTKQTEMTLLFSLPMFLLTFSACEASTGLALMVATTRTHGTDHLSTLNLLQC
uniref:NADH-ubiquinone oxidoreductase chain 4L n=1 Tax=Eurycea cirrigera TaxID=332575 RepID=A0A343ERC1_9SALA|nr:NADH dehydrogenase subunit 4L [Eurycea cirrigera]ASK85749.1 NADH dehydrogenase subunit 4L [Eurycea cirrigera]ASS30852.1 NADH dehydrogenase subunit 4L [Eurycea cirrigera]